MCILVHLMVSHKSHDFFTFLRFCFWFFLLLLLFHWFDNFKWPVFRFIDFFFCVISLLLKPSNEFLNSVVVFFSSRGFERIFLTFFLPPFLPFLFLLLSLYLSLFLFSFFVSISLSIFSFYGCILFLILVSCLYVLFCCILNLKWLFWIFCMVIYRSPFL